MMHGVETKGSSDTLSLSSEEVWALIASTVLAGLATVRLAIAVRHSEGIGVDGVLAVLAIFGAVLACRDILRKALCPSRLHTDECRYYTQWAKVIRLDEAAASRRPRRPPSGYPVA